MYKAQNKHNVLTLFAAVFHWVMEC